MAYFHKFYALLVRSTLLLTTVIFVLVKDKTLAAATGDRVPTGNVASIRFAVIASDTGKSIAILVGVLAIIGSVIILLGSGGKSGD